MHSKCESMMAEVLKHASSPMTLGEIVDAIRSVDSGLLTGATPTKSLYSMLLRREGFRRNNGLKTLFNASKARGSLLYSLAD